MRKALNQFADPAVERCVARLLRLTLASWLTLVGVAPLCAQTTTQEATAGESAGGASADRPVVILVPGVTGTELLREPGRGTAWGRGRNLILPRDGGYELALPLVGSPASPLRVGRVIEEIRLLGLFRSLVYRPILETFEAAGYRRGLVSDPQAEDGLFLFPYDWRRDNVAASHRLAETIERIRLVRNVDRLDVDLVCQSGGAHICRYLAKYGAVSLEDAAAGVVREEKFRITRMILVGSSNGGSLRILREMVRGRKYIPFVGRKWRPEVLFTFPGLFQDLPEAGALFVDAEGKALSDVDLYDAGAWARMGWSAFDRRHERRMATHSTIFGGLEERTSYLRQALDRAARFRAVLAADVGFERVCQLAMIQSSETETPTAAVLRQGRRTWKTHFVGDRFLRRRPALLAQVSAPGDGHASLESQRRLSASEEAKQSEATFFVSGSHFRMILQPETLDRLVALVEPLAAEACGSAAP